MNKIQSLLAIALISVSTNSHAYSDWFAAKESGVVLVSHDIEPSEETPVEMHLMYFSTMANEAYQNKDINTLEHSVKYIKSLYQITNDARVAFAMAKSKDDLNRLKCEINKEGELCANNIDHEVLRHMEVAGYADNTGVAAQELADYLASRNGRTFDGLAEVWKDTADFHRGRWEEGDKRQFSM
ncbi:hypothetical protein [Vibrio crassostreae]|uniref:hypothetical protein n=1 Tax=Vibrio crassostreae TaxID=246167 RepID=UPI001B30200F|nr:hypothetical protein [Vibrio crassostreae]